VDTLGLIVTALVHPADESDRDAAYRVLRKARGQTAQVQHLWADQGYTGEVLGWTERTFGWTVEIVRRAVGTIGFAVQPRRWVVERTFAWLGRSRRLSKDYEALCETTEAWILIAMISLMTRRLALRQ